MYEPGLLVIAGCNGSGKSTYSQLLGAPDYVPFDYDKCYLNFYGKLRDSDIRERIAHNMARELLDNEVNIAIQNQTNFCYETNFNSTPLFWPSHFKKHGYKLNLIYFCLNSIEEAQTRVSIRVQNGGHFVDSEEVKQRYFDGFANLNKYYQEFDVVHLFDTSEYKMSPKHILSIIDGGVTEVTFFPEYLHELVPAIAHSLAR